MAKSHGSLATVSWNGTALTAYLQDDISIVDEHDVSDVTNYGDSGEDSMVSPVQKGQQITFGGPLDGVIHATLKAAVAAQTNGSLVVRPAGAGSGLIEWTQSATACRYEVKTSKNSHATFTFTIQTVGAGSWGTQGA